MLDTNICIYLMQHQPPSVAQRFAMCREGEVVISAISLAELEYGVLRSHEDIRQQAHHALDALLKIIPTVSFNQSAAKAYAGVRATAPERRRDALDKLIASHALSLKLTLVTNNVSDFRIYPALSLENWITDNE